MTPTPQTLIADVPLTVQAEIRAAYTQDPANWFRSPAMRLWRMAMTRVMLSRGHNVTCSQFVLLVESALNLR